MLERKSQSRVTKCDSVLPHTHRQSNTKASQAFDLDRVDNPTYRLGRWNHFDVKEEVEVAIRV